MIIFNNTSADFVMMSADVLLSELRIAQLCSENEQNLVLKLGMKFQGMSKIFFFLS